MPVMTSKKYFFIWIGIAILFIYGIIRNINWKPFYWFRINLERFSDLLYNQEYSTSFISQASIKYSTRGYDVMKNSTITFIGVAKDADKNIHNVLSHISLLSAFFHSSRAVFVEGDSSDNTLENMKKWAQLSPTNRTILSHTSVGLVDKYNYNSNFSMPREGRIASARNVALEYLKKQSATDYILVVDMDVFSWDDIGIMDSFGRTDWDVMCAHGVYLHGIYRDSYAFRAPGIDTNHHIPSHYDLSSNTIARHSFEAAKQKLRLMMDKATETVDSDGSKRLVPVHSCFGGLAIYRTSVLTDCEYGFRHRGPSHLLDCEHVLLHECIRETNKAKIFSNPAMKLFFGPNSWKLKMIDIQNHFKDVKFSFT